MPVGFDCIEQVKSLRSHISIQDHIELLTNAKSVQSASAITSRFIEPSSNIITPIMEIIFGGMSVSLFHKLAIAEVHQ